MQFDIAVVGGGHAGVEAAHIAAACGHSTVLITSNIDLIAQMSCNPSVGGIAKGNIVREVDALGGVMGRAIDRAGIHWRMLNRSKGAAVWGNRAQADKVKYRRAVRRILDGQKKLVLFQGFVTAVLTNDTSVCGIELESGIRIQCCKVVLAMGTFLNGLAHIGFHTFACGRLGEPPSCGLTKSVETLGITAGRLKTGTSPRIDGRTVRYEELERQEGDPDPWPFSWSTKKMAANRVCCWITRTNSETHRAITENLNRSPLFSGRIQGIGPRYCPSIEDKVVRFGERGGHSLFIEPEGLGHAELYINGLSSSLPFDVQQRMVASLPGFAQAAILRPGYAIEYDFFNPQQLQPTLESRIVPGLYCAGQINGTSGYEEAAGQGIVAGINASCALRGEEALVLGRNQAYIGVLIDDLVTKGTSEPYRMFTSRAEYRLYLRQDNADERLMPIAARHGCVSAKMLGAREKIWEERDRLVGTLKARKIARSRLGGRSTGESGSPKLSACDALKRPDCGIEELLAMIGCEVALNFQDRRDVLLRAESDIKYSGFIRKQDLQIEKMRKMEAIRIPDTIDYMKIEGLLIESRNKLQQARPQTLGHALRIPGVTPADISVLMMYISRLSNA